MAAPTGLEQEMLEWVNRLRRDPAGEFDRYFSSAAPLRSPIGGLAETMTIFRVDAAMLRAELAALPPAPPLAWNDDLREAAGGHNAAMIAADAQEHVVPGEPDLGARITAAGYTGWSRLGENIYAYASAIPLAHAAFVVDWGPGGSGGMQPGRGHRVNLMRAAYNEVGIAVTAESNPATDVGPLVITQDFGARSSAGPFLLGVVYDDAGDGFYNNGEGLGGVTVAVDGPGGPRSTITTASGGYQMGVSPGTYSVTFSGGRLAAPVTRTVSVGAVNVKLDLERDAPASPPGGATVAFAGASLSVGEGASVGLSRGRTGDLSAALDVNLVLESVTTASTADFAPLPGGGVVRFGPGQERAAVRLTSLEDGLRESTEVIAIGLVAGRGYSIGSPPRTVVALLDDEPPAPGPPRLGRATRLSGGPRGFTLLVSIEGRLDPARIPGRRGFQLRRAGTDRVLGSGDDVRIAPTAVGWDDATGQFTLTFSTRPRRREVAFLNLRRASFVGLDGVPMAGPVRVRVAVG
jgi:hypothetical protein